MAVYVPSSSSSQPPKPLLPRMPPPWPLRNPDIIDPVIVECTDVDFTVRVRALAGQTPSVSSRSILHSLSCMFYGGTLTAILGPSGCGKTTLLNAISGRMQSRNLTLTLSLNGLVVDPVANRENVGFVQAHETLYATDTPIEAFVFVAKLKLPKRTADERRARVDQMIEALRLRQCQDTYLGSAVIKGVSSGEKKRTAVGIELIPERDILFLDEPTTGLDSVTALELMALLRDIAQQGVCVVAVIHQPSSAIWLLFDNVVFMTVGEIVYHGPVRTVVDYFASRGYDCPVKYNPADYIMFLLQTLGNAAIADLIAEYRPEMAKIRDAIIEQRRTLVHPRAVRQAEKAGPTVQLNALVKREYRSTRRDMTVVVLRLVLALVFATIIGFLFFQTGKNPGGANDASHIGLVASLGIFALFSSGQNLLIAFAAERPTALREYGSGLYGIMTYSLSKDVLEYPIVVTSVLIYLTLGYLIGGLVGSFLLLVRVVSTLSYPTSLVRGHAPDSAGCSGVVVSVCLCVHVC